MLGSRSRPYSTECSVRQAQALEQVKSEYEGRYQEKEREIVEVGLAPPALFLALAACLGFCRCLCCPSSV